jgi:hypothetical protein
MYPYSQRSRCFWNGYNVAWLCQPEASCDQTVLTTAVCSVRELRYPVIWPAQCVALEGKHSNVKGHLHKVGKEDDIWSLSGDKLSLKEDDWRNHCFDVDCCKILSLFCQNLLLNRKIHKWKLGLIESPTVSLVGTGKRSWTQFLMQ